MHLLAFERSLAIGFPPNKHHSYRNPFSPPPQISDTRCSICWLANSRFAGHLEQPLGLPKSHSSRRHVISHDCHTRARSRWTSCAMHAGLSTPFGIRRCMEIFSSSPDPNHDRRERINGTPIACTRSHAVQLKTFPHSVRFLEPPPQHITLFLAA